MTPAPGTRRPTRNPQTKRPSSLGSSVLALTTRRAQARGVADTDLVIPVRSVRVEPGALVVPAMDLRLEVQFARVDADLRLELVEALLKGEFLTSDLLPVPVRVKTSCPAHPSACEHALALARAGVEALRDASASATLLDLGGGYAPARSEGVVAAGDPRRSALLTSLASLRLDLGQELAALGRTSSAPVGLEDFYAARGML